MEQIALALRRPKRKNTWGGRRRDAGRKPSDPARPRVSHGPRPCHARAKPVHVTMRAKREAAFLRTQHVYAYVRRALRKGQRETCRTVHFSVQGDHLHLLVEAEDGATLRAGIHGLATRLARAINAALRRRGKVFADRHHRRDLSSPREVRNVLAYVLLNHRKHGATDGLAWKDGSIDPYTSAGAFDGWSARWSRLVRVLAALERAEVSPTVPPRTWLLREGWRRHGAIEPTEVPGGGSRPS